jgi:hypothetical protein
MSNKWYDRLKWVAILGLPALATAIRVIFGLWGIPHADAVAGTITAIAAMLGTWLGVSNIQYKNAQKDKQASVVEEIKDDGK